MKKSLFILSILIFSLFSQAQEVSTINMEKVFDEYYVTMKKGSQLAEKYKPEKNLSILNKKKLDVIKEELTQLSEELKTKGFALSPEVREKKVKLLESKKKEGQALYNEWQSAEQSMRKNINNDRKAMQSDIASTIMKVATKQSKAKGFKICLDSSARSANGVPIVVYTAESIDISADVLKELNTGEEEFVAAELKKREEAKKEHLAAIEEAKKKALAPK